MDYEPSQEVKKHTLEERLTDTINGLKGSELRQKIDFCIELLDELKLEIHNNRGFLDISSHKHMQYL